jgi:cell division septation protein DedD
MKRFAIIPIFLCFLAAGYLAGCGASEDASKTETAKPDAPFGKTDKDVDVTPATDQPATDKPADRPAKSEEDVPSVEKNVPPEPQQQPVVKEPPAQQQQPVGASTKTGLMMWSVQIGAFKNDAGALQLVNEVKTKFNQPVYKDFDPASGFYKVNIGSFQTREQATQFKAEVQSKGYADSFVVEARR